MDQSTIFVSSDELKRFQNKLRQLSKMLEDYHNVLTRNMRALNEKWKDRKFEEFDKDFKASKKKVKQISEKYKEWADGHLQRKIEEAIEYEKS